MLFAFGSVATAVTDFLLGLIAQFTILSSVFLHILAHLQSSVFKLSKDLIDSIHEEGIVAYTS